MVTRARFLMPIFILSLASVQPAAAITAPREFPLPTHPPELITAAAHTQSEVFAYLIAIDEQLLAMAEQALAKQIDPDIRELAVRMQTELGENLDATRALAVEAKVTVVDTTEVQASRDEGRTGLEELGKLDEADYGSRFLRAMIAADTSALDLIDKRLITDAGDDRVVKHLRGWRTLLAAHLLRAQELQSAGK